MSCIGCGAYWDENCNCGPVNRCSGCMNYEEDCACMCENCGLCPTYHSNRRKCVDPHACIKALGGEIN